MSLFCKIFGHKFEFKRTEQYDRNGEPWERVYIVQRRHCSRCCEQNPYFNIPSPPFQKGNKQ